MLLGTKFSEEELAYFKDRIKAASLEIFVTHLQHYLKYSSETGFTSEQQKKYRNFAKQHKAVSRGTELSQNFLDFSVEVWKDCGFQKYISNTFSGETSQTPCTSSKSGDNNAVESRSTNEETIMEERLSDKSSPTPSSITTYRKNVHKNDIGNNGMSACAADTKAFDTAEAKQKQQNIHSDNPAFQFLPAYERIMVKGYYPTLLDILSLRIPTTGRALSTNDHLLNAALQTNEVIDNS